MHFHFLNLLLQWIKIGTYIQFWWTNPRRNILPFFDVWLFRKCKTKPNSVFVKLVPFSNYSHIFLFSFRFRSSHQKLFQENFNYMYVNIVRRWCKFIQNRQIHLMYVKKATESYILHAKSDAAKGTLEKAEKGATDGKLSASFHFCFSF